MQMYRVTNAEIVI